MSGQGTGAQQSFPWFRFYSDVPGSIPARKLSDFEFRVFVDCCCWANRSPLEDRMKGALTVAPTGEPVTVEYIAEEVSGDIKPTLAALDALQDKRLLIRREDGAYIVAFRWQQYASDNSTPRSRKTRDKQKNEPPSSLPEETEQTEQSRDRTKGNVPANVPATSQCEWCSGTGRADDATCPQCHGSGRSDAA